MVSLEMCLKRARKCSNERWLNHSCTKCEMSHVWLKPVLMLISLIPESQDWASQQAGRLRALLTLIIRMTRKTPVARILSSTILPVKILQSLAAMCVATRIEEIQVLKDLILEMPNFKPMAATWTQT